MPEIKFDNQVVHCESGANLRTVLMQHQQPLYNAMAKYIHCRGLGTCGTCAVEIEGAVNEMTAVERWRLQFPPHTPGNQLRLACQCEVLGDLKITKHKGMWGHIGTEPNGDGATP